MVGRTIPAALPGSKKGRENLGSSRILLRMIVKIARILFPAGKEREKKGT